MQTAFTHSSITLQPIRFNENRHYSRTGCTRLLHYLLPSFPLSVSSSLCQVRNSHWSEKKNKFRTHFCVDGEKENYVAHQPTITVWSRISPEFILEQTALRCTEPLYLLTPNSGTRVFLLLRKILLRFIKL